MAADPVPLLLARLAGRAATEGDRVAVLAADGTATYGDLWARSCGLATRLADAGIVPGEPVGLAFENSLDAVVALYGCWLSGAVAIQLNATARYPDHLNWLQHSGARLLLAGASATEAQAAAAAANIPSLEVDATISGEPRTLPGPSDVASVIYTSGTSGRPKGVALSHRNFAANVDAIISYLGLTAADRTVSVLPLYYSYGASVLHTHLAAGGHISMDANLVYPHAVLERMEREGATGFAGVPSTFALLLSRFERSRLARLALRYVTQAGGAMPPGLQDQVREAFAPARLYVMYGQTEATARITYLPPEWLDAKRGSVGIAVPGTRLEVRDADGCTVPAGTPGEIWVSGDGVMPGYWRDPEATAQVLRDGWLRTGDEGWLDADGVLSIAGRRSDIIKTGAHRVHPQDIEEAAASVAGVLECAAVGAPDPVLGEVVVLFAACTPGASVDPQSLRAACRARLAAYKVPREIRYIDALPRTASGKVRRGHLRELAAGSELNLQ